MPQSRTFFLCYHRLMWRYSTLLGKGRTMEDIVSQTKAEYQRTKDRLALLLANTPDDKLNWAPSTTARTAIQLVAHSAESVAHIQKMLEGNKLEFNGTSDMDNRLRTSKKQNTTHKQTNTNHNKNNTTNKAFLDS